MSRLDLGKVVPTKGVDYWTQSDIQSIENDIKSDIKDINDFTYYYTKTQIDLNKQNITDNTLQTTNKTIPTAINEVNSIAKGTNQAISYSNYQSMITEFNSLANNVRNVGQNVMIVTLNVPDLWISSIESTSQSYTYASDSDFTNLLATNGYVQVGYYKLSALETQKVDLTNYYNKTQSDILLNSKENTSNKVTTISSNSTDTQYPSAKCVYDYIQSLDGDEVSY